MAKRDKVKSFETEKMDETFIESQAYRTTLIIDQMNEMTGVKDQWRSLRIYSDTLNMYLAKI